MNTPKTGLALTLSASLMGGAYALSQVDPTPRPGSPRYQESEAGEKPADMARTPRDFVRHAAIGGLFEVQSSQLALERSENADVRRTAERMIADHRDANERLKRIAQSKGLEVPTELDEKHKQRLDRLRNAEQNFDRAYLQAQRQAHSEAIALFEAGSQLDDEQLAGFARQTLPTLREHLQHIEQHGDAARPAGDRQQPREGGQ